MVDGRAEATSTRWWPRSHAAGLRSPVRIGAIVGGSRRRGCLADEPLERLGWQHRLGLDRASLGRGSPSRRARGSAGGVGSCVRRGGLVTLPARMHEVQTWSRLGAPFDHGPHPLDVGVPTPLGAPVGVAHVHAERGLLATDLAHCCHGVNLPEGAASGADRDHGRPSRTAQRLASPAMTSLATLARGRPACGHGGLPRRAAARTRPTSTASTSTRCPTATPGTNMALTLEAVVGRARRRRRRRRPARGLQGHRPRLAHGRPGQLRRDPLPDPPGHGRAHGRRRATTASAPRSSSTPSPTPPSWPAGPSCARWRAPSSPSPRPPPRAPPRRRRPTAPAPASSAWSRAPATEAADALARTPEHAAGAGPGRRGRRRRHRVPAPARRVPARSSTAARCPSPPEWRPPTSPP